MISIALFEPEIPQNTGTILRFADCMGILVHIIEPCGFIFGGSQMKRAGMDYLNTANYQKHGNFDMFLQYVKNNKKRIILATTKAKINYYDFSFSLNDIVLFGKESMGVPDYIHDLCFDSSITIKMEENKRSLNLAMSCGIILSEGLRQMKL